MIESRSKISVLIVDDSAVVRQVLSSILATDPGITVLGAAPDPVFAMERMNQTWPDVLVLDVEMPRMDGITFLKKIMSTRPTPTIICSTLTEQGAETTLQALAAGAVTIIAKPRIGLKNFLSESEAELLHAVKSAAKANLRHLQSTLSAGNHRTAPLTREPSQPPSCGAMAETTERIVAIGTSTGGTQALERILTALPRVSPGIVVVQHMPEKFTAAFAARLNSLCQVEVKEAAHNDRVTPGRVLIAQGGRHMQLKRSGAQYHVEVLDGPPVNRHRPSVDVLLRSVAKCAGKNATGIIMTGMGDDGARGLKEMFDAGAYTLAQDEATCVVYGMPKEAVKLGAVTRSVPLDAIPGEILRRAGG